MNKLLPLLQASLCCFLLSVVFSVSADDDEKLFDAYKKVADPVNYIAAQFATAKEQNKRVMFVLGGNWCHDSKNMIKKLEDESLKSIIEDNYLVSTIDVGYLDQGFSFAELANMKTFYATPTVLIFSADKRLINGNDLHKWGNAYSISQEEAVKYFSHYIEHEDMPADYHKFSDVQKSKWDELNLFISQQESLIKSSYSIIGPMLEEVDQKKDVKEFDDYWKALAHIRFTLPKDIKRIKEAILKGDETELAELKMPAYPSLPWQK